MIKIKDAYYFSHDANARYDPKIIKMISVYGMEGYGWYWVIIEMLREQANYKLNICGIHDINVVANQTHSEANTIQKYIDDCVKDFKLFRQNKKYLWSPSLLNRMKIMEEKREKARRAAKIRWDKEKSNHADAMPTQCGRNAIKGNKSKRNNEISDPPVLNLEKM